MSDPLASPADRALRWLRNDFRQVELGIIIDCPACRQPAGVPCSDELILGTCVHTIRVAGGLAVLAEVLPARLSQFDAVRERWSGNGGAVEGHDH